MEGWTIAAVVIAVVAVGIAFWQGWTSRQQLELARSTEARTERTLDEIRRETAETRRMAQDIKANIDDRINKILDNKLAAEQQSQATSKVISDALTAKFLGGITSALASPGAGPTKDGEQTPTHE
jgi:Flp pilus assembly protein TadB